MSGKGRATRLPTCRCPPPSSSTCACGTGASRPSTTGRGCGRSATPAPTSHGRAATGCRRVVAGGASPDRGVRAPHASPIRAHLPGFARVVCADGGISALHPGARSPVAQRSEKPVVPCGVPRACALRSAASAVGRPLPLRWPTRSPLRSTPCLRTGQAASFAVAYPQSRAGQAGQAVPTTEGHRSVPTTEARARQRAR